MDTNDLVNPTIIEIQDISKKPKRKLAGRPGTKQKTVNVRKNNN